jgi:transcriptional regulator with XRE-family HTH domain
MEEVGDRGSTGLMLFQAVGVRVRALRLQRRLTLDELSAASGVSRRMITLLEGGEANPSLGTLDKLARALGTDFASLVVARPVAQLVPEIPHRLAPVWEDGLGSTGRLLASHPDAGTTELWQWELVPGSGYEADPDPPGGEEVVLVLSGQLVVKVGPDRLTLDAGGYLRLPSDQTYAYSNPSEALTRFLRVIVSPPG